jgi:hypothetical protein
MNSAEELRGAMLKAGVGSFDVKVIPRAAKKTKL